MACIEPFDLKLNVVTPILSIDGNIDDLDTEHYIKIKSTIPSQYSGVNFSAEVQAKVSVIENQTTEFLCYENLGGVYQLPQTFKGKVGNTYQLKVKLKNGKSYESSIEKMKSTPDITAGKFVFSETAVEKGSLRQAGHLIYIDTKDNPEKGDFLFWKYRLFEKQNVCRTCEGGLYQTTPLPLGRCLNVVALQNPLTIYDYYCNTNCWDILNSAEINVMSDALSIGTDIKNRLIGKIPFYQKTGFLIEVSQQNINAELFQYLKLLVEQNQSNGTLIDSPPGALIGNVKNINDKNESVGGYFVVGNIKTRKIWVPRSENALPQYLNGRPDSPEPPGSSIDRPPLAPCVKSFTRTPLKPEGWPL